MSTDRPDTTPPPRQYLPVAELVARAYGDVIANTAGVIRIGLVWMVPFVALDLVTTPARGSREAWLLGIGNMIAQAAIAVTWHRHVMLAETFPKWAAPANSRVARYLLRGALMGLVVGVVGLVIFLIVILIVALAAATVQAIGQIDASRPAMMLVVIASAPIVLVAIARLHLVLPAAAIGDRLGMIDCWQMTEGNGLRLFAGTTLSALPAGGVGGFLRLLGDTLNRQDAGGIGSFLARLGTVVTPWLAIPLVAAFLSFSYLWFRATMDAPPPAAGRDGS